jgi:hypothetical protein
MQPSRILPDLQCSILCEQVRMEANGNFFIIGLMDVIRVPQLPITAFALTIFNRWTAGVGQFIESVRLIAPDQTTVLHKSETKFGMKDPSVNATTVTPFRNVEFGSPGAYYVEVLVDDVMKVRYPVHVLVLPPPPGATQTPAPPQSDPSA